MLHGYRQQAGSEMGVPRHLLLMLFIMLFTIFMLAICASRAASATYYVAASGNDGNAGTAAAPWQTLQHAANQVQAGDTVMVQAGSYVGFVLGWNYPQDGTASAPISFIANPGVIITSRDNETADGIDIEGPSYIIVDGFTVNNADGSITRAGIRAVEGSNVIIRNNTCEYNGTWGIFTSHSDNVLIADNVAAYSVNQHGIYVSNSCVGPVVRGNVIFGNYACGLHMNGDISQGGTGIITQALIEDNVIYNNGLGGGSGINCDGVTNSLFRNNLVYNEHGAGMSLYQIDAAAPSTDNVVVNNTFDVASDGKWAIQLHNGSAGNVLFNNIFLNHNSAHGSIHIDDAASLAGTVSDYNVLIPTGNVVTTNDDDSYLSLAAWQALGYDAHSFGATQSTLFVNWASGDYTLAAGSPAIDAGTAMLAGDPAPLTDLLGNARPAGKGYDIGCYEFGSSPDQPPAIATPASASPSRVTGTTCQLSVLGADDGGEANLTYTWSLTGTPPAPVTFSANGSNAAKVTTATFSSAGSYAFQVSISDAQGLTVSSAVAVTVTATFTSLTVAPSSATLAPHARQQFIAVARDQFGKALSAQPSIIWRASGSGHITAKGLFTAGSTGSVDTFITANAGGHTGKASVTIAQN